MERTPAACAMDWSIHLDKALRSNNPGKRMEAIQTVGVRLERWSNEPELSMAEYDMYGLLPGEDKLFSNAILLRLADTFMSSDKQTKLCVVKIFLSELKHRKTKGVNRKNKGILVKNKVENHLELLRRVKVCFNSGDEDVRALALRLFGCWSDFAKDNADIRYLILSSIVSCHIQEVKASLFAAGCFCEFSDDFAPVLLEMLVNMVSSSDMPIVSRLAGVRAFAKLGTSSTLSTRAYEEGLKLSLSSTEDDIVTTMLISLSIIASRSALLISRQVDLLLSYLTQDKTMPLQATSLRCLHIVLSRRRFRFSPPTEIITAMFNMLNGELPPPMQSDALHILYEVLMSKILSFSCLEMEECFTKLLTVVDSLMQSRFVSIRLFAMRVLADVSGKFTRREISYDENGIASQAISFLMARITLVANSVPNINQTDMEIEQEIWGLLKIIFFLLNHCPNLGEFSLNKVCLFINCLLNKDDGVLTSQAFSKLVLRISKVVNLCLENLGKSGPLSSQVQNVVRLLIEEVCGYKYLDCYVHTVYYLLLHPHCVKEKEESMIIKNEILALERAKELISLKDNWSAYKIGKYAAVQGAWFLAAFIFGELITKVHSDSCNQWLTSLALFSCSEMKKQYCSFPKEYSCLLNWLYSNRSSVLLGETDNQTTHEIENLDGVCKILQSSKEILLANGVTRLYFQIQFLSLRANVVETVGHLFNLLGTVSIQEQNPSSTGHQLSNRFLKLARGYDLFGTSFIDMDRESRMLIYSHALSCSFLAFVTGFSFFFPNVEFRSLLIQDLVGRLWCIDRETCKELMLLLETCKSSCVPQYKTLEDSHEVRSIIKILHFAVKKIAGLQNADEDNEILKITKDGLRKWLKISLRTPTYFFRVRPCVSCQLFAMNRDCGNGERISVLPGFYLHLDLCLQLREVSPETRVKVRKLYCILECKMSYEVPGESGDDKRERHMEVEDWMDDNVVELNEKLVKYVNKDYTIDKQIAETVVSFRVNGEGQGFSSCVLDVSKFPLGCYEIKWCAGCVDVDGCYWRLNSLSPGPVFTVQKSC